MGMEADYRWDERNNMEITIGTDIIRHVFAPDYDWSVIYHKNIKIWEGHNCDAENVIAVTKALGADYIQYEFTDEDEIDGCTPDSFVHIKGIKDFKN